MKKCLITIQVYEVDNGFLLEAASVRREQTVVVAREVGEVPDEMKNLFHGALDLAHASEDSLGVGE
jgi:hypothetical protein